MNAKTTTTLLLMLAIAGVAQGCPAGFWTCSAVRSVGWDVAEFQAAPAKNNGLRSYKDARLPLNGSLPPDTSAQEFSSLSAIMGILRKCSPSLFGSKWSSNVSGLNGNAVWGNGAKLPESVLANPEAYKLTSIEAWTCDLALKRNALTKIFMWGLTIWDRSGPAGFFERAALHAAALPILPPYGEAIPITLDILKANGDLHKIRMAIDNLEHWFLICKFAGPKGETVFARVEKAELGMKITDGKDFQQNGSHGASRVRNIYGQDYTLNTSARQGITLSTVIGLCNEQRQATYNIISSNCRQFAKWAYNQVTDSNLTIPTLEEMDRIEHHQYDTPQTEKQAEQMKQDLEQMRQKLLSILKK